MRQNVRNTVSKIIFKFSLNVNTTLNLFEFNFYRNLCDEENRLSNFEIKYYNYNYLSFLLMYIKSLFSIMIGDS